MVDLTIHFEKNGLDQASKVEMEKNIYEKHIPFLKEKSHETLRDKEFNMRGLWLGSCRMIPKSTRSFLKEQGIGFPGHYPLTHVWQ